MSKYKTIGKSIPRVDSFAKATGQTKFISDLSRPGMLHAKILFSDRPHAKIISIDTREAERSPGVQAVITGSSNPNRHYGLYLQDRHIFARERVRFVGDPVAAVAAVSEELAIEALKKIKVDYEDLPPIFSVEEALKPDAVLVHPDVESYEGIHEYIKYQNVCMDASLHLGDVSRGFEEADLIFEDTYQTHGTHHVALEPHACLADIDVDGRIAIWTGTQQLSVCHAQVALALNLPMTKIRIIPAWIGGGFGGKLKAQFEPIIALLTLATKKPVKLVLTRQEEFLTGRPRAPFKITIKTGVRHDGTMIAREFELLADVGAFADHVIGTATHSLAISQGPYHIPNAKARARAIYTNNRDWGCMRGYGAPQTTFAIESHMDAMAKAMNVDPAEFRLKNLAKDGDLLISTQPFGSIRIRETMQKALEASNYFEKKGKLGPHRGLGVANSMVMTGLLSSSAFVRINEDTTVSVVTGVTDIGTGTHTVLGQIAAEVLGIPVENVSIASLDSDSSPYDTGSIASRTTYDSGNAVRLAAEDARKKLIFVAADALNCSQEDILWESGSATNRNNPADKLTLAEIVGIALYANHGPLMGQGAWLAATPWEEPVGEGYGESPFGTFMYGTHIAEVEVDPHTGKTSIIKYTACHDVGQALNPVGIEGQIEGGVVQGIGMTIFEDMPLDKGQLINPSLTEYLIPTVLDVPEIKNLIDEEPDPTGPFGAKGIGEPPIIPPAAAIANAICNATGVRIHSTPLNQEKLYFAIKNAHKGE
jgi:CO/xanthine dehydrogenase Mo-binding subunit